MKRINRKTHGGWLTAEMMVAVGLMAILISVLATLGSTFKKNNDPRWVQQTLAAAGQAQMDAMTTTGKPIDDNQFHTLWPTVTCKIKTANGLGQWTGLRKVQLHLTAEKRGKIVRTDLIRYVPIDKEDQS